MKKGIKMDDAPGIGLPPIMLTRQFVLQIMPQLSGDELKALLVIMTETEGRWRNTVTLTPEGLSAMSGLPEGVAARAIKGLEELRLTKRLHDTPSGSVYRNTLYGEDMHIGNGEDLEPKE